MILPRLQVLTVNTHGFQPVQSALHPAGVARSGAQRRCRPGVPPGGPRLPIACTPRCRPGRRRRNTSIWPTACGRVRLRAQRGVSRRPPWQCRALQASDPRPPQPRRLGGGQRGTRPVACGDRHRPSARTRSACTWDCAGAAPAPVATALRAGGGLPEREPVVVAGDFNDWRQRADRLLAGCGLREVFVGAQGRPARSFPARWPVLPLDRIYLRNARGRQPRILAAALVAPVRPPAAGGGGGAMNFPGATATA